MFDIGFGELLLVFSIALVVVGPQRLPMVVKTVMGWIAAAKSLSAKVQDQLMQELQIQELQTRLKTLEAQSVENLTPELEASMNSLKEAVASLTADAKRSVSKATG